MSITIASKIFPIQDLLTREQNCAGKPILLENTVDGLFSLQKKELFDNMLKEEFLYVNNW